ncbi:MAG: hypothetical protein JXR49_23545 [Acidobacteria bacterium]|nr:hypothetical protein [Acidobacteriota bacterium]
MKSVRRKRWFPYLFLFLLFGVGPPSVGISAEVGLTPEQWKEDLDFLAENLPKAHKNLFFRLPKKDFEAQVKKISESLPGMSDIEVRIALEKLIASIGDDHTNINALSYSALYPIRFRQFQDGYYVTAARAEYRRAIGARLVKIGDTDIKEVYRRLIPLIPLENYLMIVIESPLKLTCADVLKGLHVLPDTDEGIFHFEKGDRIYSMKIKAYPRDQQGELLDHMDGASHKKPLYLSDRKANYWFRYLDDSHVLYIQYNSCNEMDSLSFADFTKRVMDKADSNPVDKVILDMRHNSGGASWLINPLLEAMKARPNLRRKNRLYVLTGNSTFSSGLMNTLQFKSILGARIIGEPSAQKPNTYGDLRSFDLPNSGMTVSYSVQYYRQVRWGNPAWIAPDVTVKTTTEDYFSGRDPVMEWVLNN